VVTLLDRIRDLKRKWKRVGNLTEVGRNNNAE